MPSLGEPCVNSRPVIDPSLAEVPVMQKKCFGIEQLYSNLAALWHAASACINNSVSCHLVCDSLMAYHLGLVCTNCFCKTVKTHLRFVIAEACAGAGTASYCMQLIMREWGSGSGIELFELGNGGSEISHPRGINLNYCCFS